MEQMKKRTLEQILEMEKKRRSEKGMFGIAACKESILSDLEIAKKYNMNKTLFTLLEDYMKRANEDIFFNKTMVLACWELINEQ